MASMPLSGVKKYDKNCRMRPCFFFCSSSFGPNSAKRKRALASVSPAAGVSNLTKTSSWGAAHGSRLASAVLNSIVKRKECLARFRV
ncbi:Uncharacterised protein [uncultured archaeon]|nr:Uncharacterised protein [uncultured archaeon]